MAGKIIMAMTTRVVLTKNFLAGPAVLSSPSLWKVDDGFPSVLPLLIHQGDQARALRLARIETRKSITSLLLGGVSVDGKRMR